MKILVLALASACALASSAAAEVVSAEAGGMEVRRVAVIAATPERVYAALAQPARWWDSEHTWSGDAANLTLDPRAGGCFCERLTGGGSVQHLSVVFADPGKTLRLRGALGPLQGMALDGAFTWSIKPAPGGAELTQTYVVGGYAKGGVDKLAPVVDAVTGAQFGRLQRYIETGKPVP